MTNAPEISVVVPLRDEAPNVAALVAAVQRALTPGPSWELLLVDDGSSDDTASIAAAAAAGDPRVRLLRLAAWSGQSAALQAGFDHSRGRLVASLDGDLQTDPAELPRLFALLDADGDMVAGYRDQRHGRSPIKRLTSRLANALVRALTGVPIVDTACTLRVYRRDVLQKVRLYSDLHRFLPVLAHSLAGARITQTMVVEHPRRAGRSKYGLGRAPRVLVDLIILKTIFSYGARPLVPFAAAAAIAALGAAAAALGAAVTATAGDGRAVVVLPGVAVVLLALAMYLTVLGLLAELVLFLGGSHGTARVPLVAERAP